MNLFLGLDGGGSHTRALVVDATGRRIGRGDSGATNPRHVAEDEARKRLLAAIGKALARVAGGPPDVRSVFVGMAGTTSETGRREVGALVASCGLAGARIDVDHDIRVALAGGLAGRPGMALIVGTGSACYGRADDGRTWQTGGWEWLIADEGSGFWLGREAIAAAARMADGRVRDTGLRAAVFEWLGIPDISELMHRLHGPDMTRAEIATLAPRVIERAAAGDPAAVAILERGADLLAEMVEANHRSLPTGPDPELVITGGVGCAKTTYRGVLESAIRRRVPAIRIREPRLSPVAGAALLAMRASGAEVTEDWIRNVSDHEAP